MSPRGVTIIGEKFPVNPLPVANTFAGVSAILRLSPTYEVITHHEWDQESCVCKNIQIC